MKFQEPISGLIERMALALERLSPIRPQSPDFERADAFVFQAENEAFTPIKDVNRVPLGLLKGIDRNRNSLQANTERFAKGLARQ
jgi:predicted AAA+ superfamily ATPase